jgi:hypothetical protein
LRTFNLDFTQLIYFLLQRGTTIVKHANTIWTLGYALQSTELHNRLVKVAGLSFGINSKRQNSLAEAKAISVSTSK